MAGDPPLATSRSTSQGSSVRTRCAVDVTSTTKGERVRVVSVCSCASCNIREWCVDARSCSLMHMHCVCCTLRRRECQVHRHVPKEKENNRPWLNGCKQRHRHIPTPVASHPLYPCCTNGHLCTIERARVLPLHVRGQTHSERHTTNSLTDGMVTPGALGSATVFPTGAT
jgi:hypothetical protein